MPMIDVTKRNGERMTLNADQIESIEEVPDTVITLTNGKKVMVKESRQKVKNLVKYYKSEILSGVLLNPESEDEKNRDTV